MNVLRSYVERTKKHKHKHFSFQWLTPPDADTCSMTLDNRILRNGLHGDVSEQARMPIMRRQLLCSHAIQFVVFEFRSHVGSHARNKSLGTAVDCFFDCEGGGGRSVCWTLGTTKQDPFVVFCLLLCLVCCVLTSLQEYLSTRRRFGTKLNPFWYKTKSTNYHRPPRRPVLTFVGTKLSVHPLALAAFKKKKKSKAINFFSFAPAFAPVLALAPVLTQNCLFKTFQKSKRIL